jgi:hypothetical protein
MVAVANPGTGQATFQVFGGKGGVKIAADSIVANSITANEIAATITWSKDFVVAANGKIRQGKTSSDDLTAGIYIGYDGVGSYDLHIGDETNALKWDGSAGTLVLMGRFFRTDAVIAPGGGLDQLLAYFQMSGNTNSVSFVTIKRFTPDFTGTFNLFATVSTSAGTGDWEITRNGTQILFGDNQITTTPQNLGGQVTNSNVDDWYEFRVRHNTGGGSSVNYSNPRIEGLRNDLGRWT